MCWSGLRCRVYSRCFTFMLKRFTFSLSKHTELPTSLDVFLSLFRSLRVFSLCLDEVPPTWSKFPRITYIQKKNVFFHIHEINTDGRVAIGRRCLYTNHNQLVLANAMWQNRVSKRACESRVPVWKNFPQATLHGCYTSPLYLGFCLFLFVSFYRVSWHDQLPT